jgi:hypothetical protein
MAAERGKSDMKADISSILNGWEYDPENCIRIARIDAKRKVLQVRLAMGIEQYELDGRPDGKTPFDKESMVDYFYDKLEYHKIIHSDDHGFKLTHEDFLMLQSEGLLYYYRYLVLFQMGDFDKTARDTEHNLKLCELLEKYRQDEEDKNAVLQYRPYILRMNAISNAMISLHKKLKSVAQQILKSAIDLIRNFPDIDTPAYRLEKNRSLDYLESTLDQIMETEVSRSDKLQAELDAAVEAENYERAAELRDMINGLKAKEGK